MHDVVDSVLDRLTPIINVLYDVLVVLVANTNSEFEKCLILFCFKSELY